MSAASAGNRKIRAGVATGRGRTHLKDRRAVEATGAAQGGLNGYFGNAGIGDFMSTREPMDIGRLPAIVDKKFGMDAPHELQGERACVAELQTSSRSMIRTASTSSVLSGSFWSCDDGSGVGMTLPAVAP